MTSGPYTSQTGSSVNAKAHPTSLRDGERVDLHEKFRTVVPFGWGGNHLEGGTQEEFPSVSDALFLRGKTFYF